MESNEELVSELSALPFELLVKVMSNLTAFECLRLSQCSSYFRMVALHDQVFARHIVSPGPLVIQNPSPNNLYSFETLERLQIPLNLQNDLRLYDWIKSPFHRFILQRPNRFSIFRELHTLTEALYAEEASLIDIGLHSSSQDHESQSIQETIDGDATTFWSSLGNDE
jgi:hypothetical protein